MKRPVFEDAVLGRFHVRGPKKKNNEGKKKNKHVGPVGLARKKGKPTIISNRRHRKKSDKEKRGINRTGGGREKKEDRYHQSILSQGRLG